MKKSLPIGISDFEKLISENYYFVDKSLFIKEILDNKAEVTLIPRPRRFGKTLNLSMLQYFFEATKKTQKHLFDNLEISKHPAIIQEHQGKYPVIFITFKDIKQLTWDSCYDKIQQLISNEFNRHSYLLEASGLNLTQKKDFEAIIDRTASQASYENSIKDLCEYLEKYHKQKPIILIDEYDSPIQAGFINNYYNDIINFMRGLLCAGLKDNNSLGFAVLTGILRIAKESIFSGVNNLDVCSILNSEYADKFGLTQDEVSKLLHYYGITDTSVAESISEVKKWYDGYSTQTDISLYNPWSIINFAKKGGIFQPYWINTSSNDIVKELFLQGEIGLKRNIESMIAGNEIEKPVSENIVFQQVYSRTDAVWSFLLFSGYLTFTAWYLKDGLRYCKLKIPNEEVSSFYKEVVLDWLKEKLNFEDYTQMLQSLVSGDVEQFKEIFYDITLKSFSYFDIKGKEPENFYHAFVLGMLVSLEATHQVKSNRESGYGRYDVMLIPKNTQSLGILIEFKKVNKRRNETLEIAADNALKQIYDKKYAAELESLGIKKILKLGISFEGKKCLIKEA
jgi:hypothetical protein